MTGPNRGDRVSDVVPRIESYILLLLLLLLPAFSGGVTTLAYSMEAGMANAMR